MNMNMKIAILGAVLASSLALSTQAAPLTGEMVAENISVIKTDNVTLHTFMGISNSHILETATQLRIVDAQMTFPQAKALRAYAETLDKPIVAVILSHNHPDHWFGAEIFSDVPVITSENVATDIAEGGGRYIEIMKERMADIIPTQVIEARADVVLGAQNWDGLDVVVEEYPDQESHHSLMIKIPSIGVMIGQDMFYNNMYLVASERSRNINWRNQLSSFLENEMLDYETLLVGHGSNGGKEILEQDIAYLDALERVMAQNLGPEATKAKMMELFPEKQGEGMLDISIRNLHAGH